MHPAQLVMRCYAENDGDSWFAICLDLNVYARADSFEEARARLEDRVSEYVNEALTIDAAHAATLLNRRAPVEFWLKFYFWSAVQWFRRPSRPSHLRFTSLMPIHAC